jgi:hypothetical protein
MYHAMSHVVLTRAVTSNQSELDRSAERAPDDRGKIRAVATATTFALVDPRGDRVPNAIMPQCTLGAIPSKVWMSIHLLVGVFRFGYTGGPGGVRVDDRTDQARRR